LVFPAAALLSWQDYGIHQSCPVDFWSWMCIGFGSHLFIFTVWMLYSLRRKQALTAIIDGTIIFALVGTLYLGAVLFSLTINSAEPGWCGPPFGWGLLIFTGVAAGVALFILLCHSIVLPWQGARESVEQRQQQQQHDPEPV